MILEALYYLLTPCRPEARRLGYLKRAIALQARHRRCATAWHSHVVQCRTTILEAAERCMRHDRVVIVGSGLLVEVPLAELAARFARVELVDIVHLPAVRRQARRHANVTLTETDITGVAAHLAFRPVRPADARPEFRPPDLGVADLAVSANLLSQLPLVPLDHIDASDQDGAVFAQRLMAGHLDWLRALGRVACLITDVERRRCDGPRLLDRQGALFGLELPAADREWWWCIAPRPERYADSDVQHRVIGIVNLNGPKAGGNS